MSDLNTIIVSGEISQLEPVRFTPAGLAILDFTLVHYSLQKEAKMERKVNAEFQCILIGETEQKLAQIQCHTSIKVKGFMAAISAKRPYRLVLHVTAYELLN